MSPVSLMLNILWVVLGGFWMAFGWAVAVVIMAITIIGLLLIPAGVVLFFLSILTLGLGFLLLPMIFFIVAGPYFALTLGSSAQATSWSAPRPWSSKTCRMGPSCLPRSRNCI